MNPRLSVTRDNAWYGRLRKLRVLLDGTEIGRLASGETKVFEISSGAHELVVQMDWVKSQPTAFTCRDGDELSVQCVSPRLSFSLRDLFFINAWERASKPFSVSLVRRGRDSEP